MFKNHVVTQLSKWDLAQHLFCNGMRTITVRTIKGDVQAIIQQIEREDGSGSKFNLRVRTLDHQTMVLFVKTTD